MESRTLVALPVPTHVAINSTPERVVGTAFPGWRPFNPPQQSDTVLSVCGIGGRFLRSRCRRELLSSPSLRALPLNESSSNWAGSSHGTHFSLRSAEPRNKPRELPQCLLAHGDLPACHPSLIRRADRVGPRGKAVVGPGLHTPTRPRKRETAKARKKSRGGDALRHCVPPRLPRFRVFRPLALSWLPNSDARVSNVGRFFQSVPSRGGLQWALQSKGENA